MIVKGPSGLFVWKKSVFEFYTVSDECSELNIGLLF